MTTSRWSAPSRCPCVVEAYRLDRYDNFIHDNAFFEIFVVEAYRLDRYDNFRASLALGANLRCRSLSFG